MTHLYSCRHDSDQYRITKWSTDLEVEASYLTTLAECDCPAGSRDTCRHRQMLPRFISRSAVDSDWFYDHDRGGWVQIALPGAEPGAGFNHVDMDYSNSVGHGPAYGLTEPDATKEDWDRHVAQIEPSVADVAVPSDDIDWDILAEERLEQRPRIDRRGR